MPLRYRRAKPNEVRGAMPLLEPDRPLLSRATWQALPELLEDLLMRERILMCVLEDSDTGCLRFLGGSGFLDRQFLQAALGDPPESVLDRALATERKAGRAFLNVRQVGDANRRTDLRLLTFFGATFKLNPNLEIGMVTEAWSFFHKGFHFDEIWAESADPVQARLLGQVGMRLHRKHTSRTGDPVWLLRVSREDALRTPAAWPASAMLSSQPRFGFTRGQQKLLELALLDHSDGETAERLDLSEDALKKRWRSIYIKVSGIEPRLLQPDDSGAVQRRALLHRLRHNLEELRPF